MNTDGLAHWQRRIFTSAIAIVTLLVLPGVGGAQQADDFSGESGLWTYHESAVRDGASEYVILTESIPSDVGRVWLTGASTLPGLTAEFKFRMFGGSGAGDEGLVFMFYKDSLDGAASGSYLGFTGGGDTSETGYGIAFRTNPASVALIHTHASRELAWRPVPRLADGAWHSARVQVDVGQVRVFLDGDPVLRWTGTLDRTHGGIGFAAATNDFPNRHLLDDVTIRTSALSVSQPADGSTLSFSPLTVTGVAAAGAGVTVALDGPVILSTIADSEGAWSATLAEPLADGLHTLTATATLNGMTESVGPITFEVVTAAPQVSGLRIDGLSEIATMRLSLSKPASAVLEYGTSSAYGRSIVSVPGASHTFALAPLTPDTTYYYRILLEDSEGRQSESTGSFMTLPAGTVTPAVAAGSNSSIALLPDGTVWFWGWTGAWGSTSSIDIPLPTQVPGPGGAGYLTDVLGIAGSLQGHHLAVRRDGTVWAWGENQYGELGVEPYDAAQSDVPLPVPGLSGVVTVAGGGYFSLALHSDGTVSSWGHNTTGQLGQGTATEYELTPGKVVGLTDVVAVAAGEQHALALKADGTVWAWGEGGNGQLGIGVRDTILEPVQVPGLTGVTAIAAGSTHSLALKSDGTVWAWGVNSHGELGIGTGGGGFPHLEELSPVQVQGLTGAVMVAAGYSHSLAVDGTGQVWAWGSNWSGQIGDGSESDRNLPQPVGRVSQPLSLAAGYGHSVAFGWDGTVWTWGDNWNGQLGNGRLALDSQEGYRTRPAPARLKNGFTPVMTMPAADDVSDTNLVTFAGTARPLSTIAVTVDGAQVGTTTAGLTGAWSLSATTPLADGAATAIATATSPTGAVDTAAPVAFSVDTSMVAVRKVVLRPVFGAASLAFATSKPAAATVEYGTGGSYNRTVELPRGVDHFAILSPLKPGVTYEYRLTARDLEGRTSQPATGTVEAMAQIGAAPGVAGGTSVSAALLPDGSVRDWGNPDYGLVSTPRVVRTEAGLDLGDIVALAPTLGEHLLARRAVGTYAVWGATWEGALGTGVEIQQSSVALEGMAVSEVVGLSGGKTFTLALLLDGTVWGWGYNNYGQLGDGTNTNLRLEAVQAATLTGVIAIAGGGEFSLALKADGTVWAWGGNWFGQLGDGTQVDRPVPGRVEGLDGVVAIAAGDGHALALRADGTVWAWGYNDNGQTGSAPQGHVLRPRQVAGLAEVVAISAGSQHSLAVRVDGTLWAWGWNYSGQIGNGKSYYDYWQSADTSPREVTPVQVAGLRGVVAVAAGYLHSLAWISDGTLWSWGANSYYQIGDGTSTERKLPVQVMTTTPFDTESPGIYHVGVAWDGTDATISFQTDEGVTAEVEFGQTDAYGSTESTGYGIRHSAVLSGLTADTAYAYRITALDAAGNPSVAVTGTFTTIPPPSQISGSVLAPLLGGSYKLQVSVHGSDGSQLDSVEVVSGGDFELEVPGPGSYWVRLHRPGWLSQVIPITVASGQATADIGPVSLLFGDLDGDGKIDRLDLTAYATRYLQTPERPEWDVVGADGLITLEDLYAAARNAGESTEVLIPTP